MNTKFTLAIIALVGIGVFALPSTMSLFAGQHSFYNIDQTGNQIPCQKCHGDVQAELSANADSITGTPGPHAAMSCEYCHRIEAGASSGDDAIWLINYVNGSGAGAVKRQMAISIFDFENGSIPTQINSLDNISQIAASINVKFVNANVSNPTDTSINYIMKAPDRTKNKGVDSQTFVKLYDDVTNAPKDLNPDTKNSGVQLTGINSSQWIYNGTDLPKLNFYGLGSRVVNPGSKYHAASLVSCMECHSGPAPVGHETTRTVGKTGPLAENTEEPKCSDCHYGDAEPGTGNAGKGMRNLWAGGFGVTKGNSHSVNDQGTVEAHTPWLKSTTGVSRDGAGRGTVVVNNDACIACHTHVAVDITFDKAYKLKLTATAGNNTHNGGSLYTVGNEGVEGHVVISVFGNQSGQTFAVGDQSITWTSDEAMYINGDKSTTAAKLTLVSDSTDDKAALQ